MRSTMRLWRNVGWQLLLAGWLAGLPAAARAQVLFQEDFERLPADWNCGTGGTPPGWSQVYPGGIGCGYTPGFGYELTVGPGHNGGNALYAWKSSVLSSNWEYRSHLSSSTNFAARELYTRWYMRIPPTFDKATNAGCKLWRYLSTGANAVYLQLNQYAGSTIATGAISVILRSSTILDVLPNVQHQDDRWHAHELYLKINDATSPPYDGVVEYWLDGVKVFEKRDADFGMSPTDTLTEIYSGFGMGNCSDSPWFMTSWTALQLDDLVISTTGPIGPIGPADTLAPAAPTNLTVQ